MSTETEASRKFPDVTALMKDEKYQIFLERMSAVQVSDVETRQQSWLWPGRIPLGDLTVLAGDPGVGKSLLALDLVARVTRGGPWPDEAGADDGCGKADDNRPPLAPSSAPGSVILLTTEDSLATTVRPRLAEAGADVSRIVSVRMTLQMEKSVWLAGSPPQFELRRDLQLLRKLVHAMPDCRLIVIDSITSFLSENSESIRSDDHGVFLRLLAIARERKVAVVNITHLRKKGGRAIYSSLGSLAFVATARAAWAVAKDPETANRRLLVPIKNNLAADLSGLAFTIESGPISGAAKIRWSPEPVRATADTVESYGRRNGRPDDERRNAMHWLRERLADGPSAVKELWIEAEVNGFTRNTLRRAFRELRGKAIKEATANGPWTWQLPVEDAQNPRGEFWAPSTSPREIDSSPGSSLQQAASDPTSSIPQPSSTM